jgi:hypothetical protein
MYHFSRLIKINSLQSSPPGCRNIFAQPSTLGLYKHMFLNALLRVDKIAYRATTFCTVEFSDLMQPMKDPEVDKEGDKFFGDGWKPQKRLKW